MRVLIMAKEGDQSEAATPPTPEAMAEYQKFNEELIKAGVVLEAGRLYPSSQSKRVRFDGKKRTVIDGPFAETKELVAGYWLWQVRSIDEALEWLKRAPYDGGTFEIREILEFEGIRRCSRDRTATRSRARGRRSSRGGCRRSPSPGRR